MAITNKLDSQGIVRAVDSETNLNLGTYGAEDMDQSDYLEIKGNGTPRWLEIAGKNDGEDWAGIPTIYSALVQNPEWFVLDEDFVVCASDDTTGLPLGWIVTGDAGMTGQTDNVTDTVGGVFTLYCDGDDNDAANLHTAGENWLFADNKPLLFMCRLTHTVATANSSWVVGLSDLVTADLTVDAGTLATSYDGCLFQKDEGGSHVLFASSNATTQNSADLVAWTDGDTFEGGFVFDSAGGTTGTLTPFYLSTPGTWSTLTWGTAQTITLAGLQEMHAVAGVKTHEAAEQNIAIDYIKVVAKR